MLKQTALHARHQALGAKLVDFAGWEMPIHYGSQIDEHHAVRQQVGMFDVAHMAAVDLTGPRTREFLQYLLANDVAKLQLTGKALYSCMLNEQGGVIDDLITYFINEEHFRLVVNAGTASKDFDWISEQARAYEVNVLLRDDLGILAVQGPQARETVLPLLSDSIRSEAFELKPFQAVLLEDQFVSRTGYTGEDGFELIFPHAALQRLWDALIGAGVQACGLGARDTLRLEAAMNLYGQDMDESVTPLVSGLAWTVAMKDARPFIGRAALEAQAQALPQRQIGLILQERGVLRGHQKLRFSNGATGELTSGGFSPTMKQSIGLARVDHAAEGDCEVEIRGKWLAARVVKPPFVRNGQILIDA